MSFLNDSTISSFDCLPLTRVGTGFVLIDSTFDYFQRISAARISLFVEIRLAYRTIGDVMVTMIVMINLTKKTVVSISILGSWN